MSFTINKPRMLLADKGYDSDDVRENLLLNGILPVIPPRSNRSQPISCDYRRYRNRNRIERMFNRLKQFRRIATRYDMTAKSFLAFLSSGPIKGIPLRGDESDSYVDAPSGKVWLSDAAIGCFHMSGILVRRCRCRWP
jgi:hypothetical protein